MRNPKILSESLPPSLGCCAHGKWNLNVVWHVGSGCKTKKKIRGLGSWSKILRFFVALVSWANQKITFLNSLLFLFFFPPFFVCHVSWSEVGWLLEFSCDQKLTLAFGTVQGYSLQGPAGFVSLCSNRAKTLSSLLFCIIERSARVNCFWHQVQVVITVQISCVWWSLSEVCRFLHSWWMYVTCFCLCVAFSILEICCWVVRKESLIQSVWPICQVEHSIKSRQEYLAYL